jgi:superfamily II DNA or RNA helicase
MKPFSEIEIADGTSPGENVDVVNDIYVPALQNSNLHQRLTYSFSAYGLVELAAGLEKFIKNKGRMQLIIGSTLSEGEEKAIHIAETQRKKNEQYLKLCMVRLNNLFESIISDATVVESHVPKSLDLLTNLIASNTLEIKFAYKKNTMRDLADISIQHSKIAIFHGMNDEKVVWGGSTNLSVNALVNSIEEISVFKSWDADSGYKRHGKRLIDAFNKAWENKVDDWHTCAVPSKFYKDWKDFHKKNSKLLKIAPTMAPTPAPTPSSTMAPTLAPTPAPTPSSTMAPTPAPNSKNWKLRPHQNQVIRDWIVNSYKGIVEHATGSGKTVTGIFAIKHFFEVGGTKAIIIVPSILLQDQWSNELHSILGNNIIITKVGGEIGKNVWQKRISGLTKPDDKKKIIIAVGASAAKKSFYENVHGGNHLMILADEVHRLGANQFKNMLDSVEAKYRMGLSATVERANDLLGTKRLYQFFGNPLKPVYGLAEAIKDKRLVKYLYTLCEVYLTPEETEEWISQSKEINRQWARFKSDKNKKIMPANLQLLLIERAKISKKAEKKIPMALTIIKDNFKEEPESEDTQRWLIYCQDIQQLEELKKELLLNGFTPSIYHSLIPKKSKEATLKKFELTGGLLLSIKCLDEGIDIPAADHALILASSSNKREYIQRRGRVLRVDPDNKRKRAKIFDLLTLSREFDEESIKSLIRTEVLRASEFGENARNSNTTKVQIEKLYRQYNFTNEDKEYSYINDIEEE